MWITHARKSTILYFFLHPSSPVHAGHAGLAPGYPAFRPIAALPLAHDDKLGRVCLALWSFDHVCPTHAGARTLPVASAYECEARMQAIHGMQGVLEKQKVRS